MNVIASSTARNLRNTPDTQFVIASMNKMFTAVAVLQLVSQGKLALDVPIATYWPDYPNHDTGDIFVSEVQTHRSELHTLADVVPSLGIRPVEFQPGTQWEYSSAKRACFLFSVEPRLWARGCRPRRENRTIVHLLLNG